MAIASLGWFVLTLVLEHALVPELGPARHTISEYANAGGVAGPLMTVGFLVWAASLTTTALLVLRAPLQGGAGAARNVLFALLLVAAVGVMLIALFPTRAGRLHSLGSDLVQVCFYPAVLLSLMLPGPRWFRIVAVALLVVAVAVAPALAALGVDAAGARQRVQLAAGCGWQFALLAAWRSAVPAARPTRAAGIEDSA